MKRKRSFRKSCRHRSCRRTCRRKSYRKRNYTKRIYGGETTTLYTDPSNTDTAVAQAGAIATTQAMNDVIAS